VIHQELDNPPQTMISPLRRGMVRPGLGWRGSAL